MVFPAEGVGLDPVLSADRVAEVVDPGLPGWAVGLVGDGVVLVLVAGE